MGTLTSDSQTDLGEIQPALSIDCGIPSLLNWYALYNDCDAGKERDENSTRQESPDEPYLNLVAHDSEKEDTNGALAHADDHNTSYLAENFIFDSLPIYIGITHVSEQTAETISRRYSDKCGINNLEYLQIRKDLPGEQRPDRVLNLPKRHTPSNRQAQQHSESICVCRV